jgi:UDP-N-acetyl-2-amino-2-deoxyglucuronate dehydrogenase
MAGKYGVAILGAGWVAGEYVKVFRDHPQTELRGVYNRTPGKATRLLGAHGVSAREYASADELFDDDGVRIIVSCTSPDVRPEHVSRAARSGRHVVIEKPIALSWSGVQEIYRAVTDAGVKSVTSFVLRWNPQFETIKQLIADGVVGDLIYAEADYWHPMKREYPSYPWTLTRALGGSSFIAAGCHAADALRYFGGEVSEVAAFSTGPRKDMGYEFDPTVVASLKFENGAVGKLSSLLDGDTPYIFNIRLFGNAGTIQNNRVYSKKHYPGALNYWTFPTIEPDSGDVAHHPFAPEIAHFIDCIDNNIESHASIRDTFRSMAVCFAIDESAAKGGAPVKVNYRVAESEPALAGGRARS